MPSIALEIIKVVALAGAAFFLNLPFGSYRNTTRKFSLGWFLAIHLPVPLVIVMRSVVFGLGYWAIPFSLAGDIAGQILGARLQWFSKPLEQETQDAKI